MKFPKIKRIWSLAAALLILDIMSIYPLAGTYARYTSSASGSSTAMVAAWDVTLEGTEVTETGIYAGLSDYGSSEYSTYGIDSTAADGNGYAMGGYKFTVRVSEGSQVSGSLSVKVNIYKNGESLWPDGMKAALYSVTGAEGSEKYTFISENSTGIFNDVKTVAPGTAYTGNYLVCFKASSTTVAERYNISVNAEMNQVD